MNLETLPWLPQVPTCPQGTAEDPRREEGAPEAEWLETDGLGGYALSTVSGTPHRRYHGLLTAVPEGTTKRTLFLAGLLDRLATSSGEATLTRLRRPGEPPVVPPDGFGGLSCVPWPRTLFRHGRLELTREVLMPEGRSAVLVRYTLAGEAGAAANLVLEPLLAFREADALTFENDVLREHAEQVDGGLRFRPYDALPAMTITLTLDPADGVAPAGWRYEPAPRWHRGVEYATDLARGYDGHEDLFAPGVLHVRLRCGDAVTLAATIDGAIGEASSLFRAEAARRRAALPVEPTLGERFGAAADAFLYRGPGGRRGVLAGFPWFGEWGRDTFIALPGLTLARGDVEACGEILGGALAFLRDGLLPNIFGRNPEDCHYGSADAALWFARAVLLYQRAGGDEKRVRRDLAPALAAIAEAYRDGTASRLVALGVRADAVGLLHVGTPARNPTWMDAQTPAGPVTPRFGHPVEINALWCSLLAHLAELTGADVWIEASERAAGAFLERFWRQGEGVLVDVWREDEHEHEHEREHECEHECERDLAIRPNMVLAAALELSPLDCGMRGRVLARAEADLLTPYGLRTLAPSDPDYRSRYGGGPEARDAAYHQGTVWPWLLGFYCEASLRVDASEANRARLRRLWEPLAEDLGRGGLGHVSEVYDGDAPHRRGGTCAQAWSTAEAMRALALLDGSLSLGGDATS